MIDKMRNPDGFKRLVVYKIYAYFGPANSGEGENNQIFIKFIKC